MQLLAGGMGLVAMFVMTLISYRLLAKLWFVHLPITLGLVLVTFTSLPIVYQPPGSDDTAWLRVGSFSLQPSELLKISFILTFALHLSKVREHMTKPLHVLLLCIHGAVPCLLIYMPVSYTHLQKYASFPETGIKRPAAADCSLPHPPAGAGTGTLHS